MPLRSACQAEVTEGEIFKRARREPIVPLGTCAAALADRVNGGRSRFVGDNLRAYSELLCSEMDRCELKYTPINLYDWAAGNERPSETPGKASLGCSRVQIDQRSGH
jgi:hypothetical protein